MSYRILAIVALAGCDASSLIKTAHAGSAQGPMYCDILQPGTPRDYCIAPNIAAPVANAANVLPCTTTEMWTDLPCPDAVAVGWLAIYSNSTMALRATVTLPTANSNLLWLSQVSAKPNAPQGSLGCWCSLRTPAVGVPPNSEKICAGTVYGTDQDSCGAWVQLEGATDATECRAFNGGSLSGSFEAYGNAGWHTVDTANLTCAWAAYLK